MSGDRPENEGIRTMSMAIDAAHEARGLIGEIGGHLPFGTPLKTVQAHVARLARLPERRVRAFWNSEVRRPHDDEMKALRRAAARSAEEAAADEFDELKSRLARLESLMATVDPEFFGPAADALRRAVRGHE